jgi:hypothetical protein
LIALSIGVRLRVSNVRDAPPLANENPAVPLPSDDALYDAAAKPEAAHGRGLGDGEGDGDGAGDGNAGDGAGGVCAATGTVPRAHAAVKAAMKVRKTTPNVEQRGKKKPCELAQRTAVVAVVDTPPRRRALRRGAQSFGNGLRARRRRGRRGQHEPRADESEECDH